MDKRSKMKDGKVVIYPGLVKRLIEKGMDALKEKDGQMAFDLFEEAELHEQNNAQVLFGKMLSLIELGRLHDALECSATLLYEGIGDYFDNLQVHISLLVQLEKYEEVVEIISAVLSEHRVPAQYAESFYQLLHFSRQLIDDDALQQNRHFIAEQERLLQSNQLELQLKAIQQLKKIDSNEANQLLVSFIENEHHDLALKSVALYVLSEKRYDQAVHIKKLGQTKKVIPKELVDLFEVPFVNEVLHRLTEEIEQENPFLYEIAKHLCTTYLFATYPFIPPLKDAEFWAGVFHYCGAKRLGLEEQLHKIEEVYHLNKEVLFEAEKEIEMIEATVFKVEYDIQ